MKSQTVTATTSWNGPVPQSGSTRLRHSRPGDVISVNQVVSAMPPVTTVATPAAFAIFRAGVGSGGSTPSASASASARRAYQSAIVVPAAAPTAEYTSALPNLPFPGVNGFST